MLNLPQQGNLALIFTSKLRCPSTSCEYAQTARRMDDLVSSMPGFLGMQSSRSEDGIGITISYWRDEQALLAWRNHPQHLAAQQLGRDQFYEWYKVVAARVERSYAKSHTDNA